MAAESPRDPTPSEPAEAVAESASEPELETPAAPPSGPDLSQAALFRDPDDVDTATEPEQVEEAEAPESVPDADDDEPAAEDTTHASDVPGKTDDEQPKPAASGGPAHTPRTDADISGSGSLFDL